MRNSEGEQLFGIEEKMADIKLVKDRENKQEDYRDKILKYRLTNIYRFVLLLMVFVAVIILIVVQYRKHVYTDYSIMSTVARQSGEKSTPLRLGKVIMNYSEDGSNCIDLKGEAIWNQTYQLQDIEVAVNRDVSALCSYNGNQIFIQNAQECLGEITTTMPIRDITVSANGRVTAILADTDATWVNTYDSDGELLFYGESYMQNSGYPVAVSLSPNGELLGVSYVYLDAGTVKTNIVFYNFGPVGANQSDYLVSTQSYADMLTPYIQFMDDETAFAVGDSRLMIYKGAQKPVSVAEYFYNDTEIKSIFYSEKYIGLILASDKAENRYRLDVFGLDAQKVGSFYFDLEYSDMFFEDEGFVIYNETECLIMNMDGLEKFRGDFNGTVELMVPTGSAYRYVLVTRSSLDTIQLN